MIRETKTKLVNAAHCLCVVLSMVGLAACQEDSSDDFADAKSQQTVASKAVRSNFPQRTASTRTLVAVTDSVVYQPAEFAQTLAQWPLIGTISQQAEGVGRMIEPVLRLAVNARVPRLDSLFAQQVGVGEKGQRQWQLKRYTFTYNSVSCFTGADTLLGGSVIFPTNMVGMPHEVGTLTLYHHQAYNADSWLPSQSLTMMGLHALHNSAVIESDMQGSLTGFVVDSHYLLGDLICLQTVDCALAALEVMRNHGVTLAADGYTNSWGTSLGVVSALGFAQYMENDASEDLQRMLNLRASFVGEGPGRWTHMRGLEELDALVPVQKYANGWNPRLPLYMSYCPNDEVINYQAVKDYYAQLRTLPDGTVDDNVHWIDFNVVHTELERQVFAADEPANHQVSALLSLFYATMAEDPADMVGIMAP